ncbi:uncharacterized protein LTR77_005727 [Saxophila tyrrhenica]|uniref:CENP-V/GFA domain-containing protein n=1 Tax=Saxophila tyrrhenica TaxID=1690608 RepID=A0AAV9PCR9_9PEZI|nr:hypothetical protein LTR77_005727 [Saxophila tyrrhenica]
MDVKCQCGAISFKTPTPEPIKLFHCHCLECRKQSGSAFGTSAIFTAEGLIPLPEDLESKMSVWTRPTDAGGMMDCYFCKRCGNRILHRARDESGSERGTVSIKAGVVEGLKWEGAGHIYTRSAVVDVPEGGCEGAPE